MSKQHGKFDASKDVTSPALPYGNSHWGGYSEADVKSGKVQLIPPPTPEYILTHQGYSLFRKNDAGQSEQVSYNMVDGVLMRTVHH